MTSSIKYVLTRGKLRLHFPLEKCQMCCWNLDDSSLISSFHSVMSVTAVLQKSKQSHVPFQETLDLTPATRFNVSNIRFGNTSTVEANFALDDLEGGG